MSFSYEIIDLPSESIGILVDMKFMIGDLLYEKIGADIVITGYDQDEASWVKKYENVQPKYILQVDMSYDHYKIEMLSGECTINKSFRSNGYGKEEQMALFRLLMDLVGQSLPKNWPRK